MAPEPEQKPERCPSCGFLTPDLSLVEPVLVPELHPKLELRRRPVYWLCDLCAGSLAGSAMLYPDAYPEAKVLKTICYVGNEIINEIRKLSAS